MRTLYILRCSDNTLYTGITTDLERRINEHNTSSKGATYTKARRPVRLVRYQQAKNRSLASKLEIFIKKKTKAQKEIMIKKKIIVSL